MVWSNSRADGRGRSAHTTDARKGRTANKLTQAAQRFYFACLAAGLTPAEARREERQIVTTVRAQMGAHRLTIKAARELAARVAS